MNMAAEKSLTQKIDEAPVEIIDEVPVGDRQVAINLVLDTLQGTLEDISGRISNVGQMVTDITQIIMSDQNNDKSRESLSEDKRALEFLDRDHQVPWGEINETLRQMRNYTALVTPAPAISAEISDLCRRILEEKSQLQNLCQKKDAIIREQKARIDACIQNMSSKFTGDNPPSKKRNTERRL